MIVRYGAGLIAVGLIWLLLSREVYDYCTLGTSNADDGPAQAALSVTWMVYAALLLWIGFSPATPSRAGPPWWCSPLPSPRCSCTT